MPKQRFANIDGLRAIAALGVMIEHLFGDELRQTAAGPMHGVAASVVENVSLGRFGVVLFFLISGFVVPFSFSGERPIAHFVILRAFRLYPAFWLALAVLATMAAFAGDPASLATVLANLTMMPSLLGRPWLSPIYWTLSIELVFYVVVLLLFALGRLRHTGTLYTVGFGLVVATVLPVWLRIHGLANLPVQYLGLHLSFLFLGMLLRLWLVERVRSAGVAAFGLVIAQAVTVVAVSDFSMTRDDHFIMIGLAPTLSAYALAFVTFLLAVRFDRPRSLTLAGIGQISYSMYLFHWCVNVAVIHFRPLTGLVSDLGVMLICVALTMAVSALTYYVVERPMIMLGRAIALRYDAARGKPQEGVRTTL